MAAFSIKGLLTGSFLCADHALTADDETRPARTRAPAKGVGAGAARKRGGREFCLVSILLLSLPLLMSTPTSNKPILCPIF
jgi:hypothetical protein